jgi:AcrR family transcriptional regulator
VIAPSSPRSRRERPAKPALSQEAIIAAAVAILRDEGLEHLTMRRLASALDTGAASLYVYFRSTAELHAAVLDALLGTVTLEPTAGKGSWQDRITRVLASYTSMLMAHATLARSALVSRPSGPNYLALVERLLRLLQEGRVPHDRAAWGIDLLLLFATSLAAEHGPRELSADVPAQEEALVTALRNASGARYPAIAAVGEDLLSGPPEARYAWGITVLLAGIAAVPRPIQETP